MKIQFENNEEKIDFIEKMIDENICPYVIDLNYEEPFGCPHILGVSREESSSCKGCWEIALSKRKNEGVFVLAASDGYSIEQASYFTLEAAQNAMKEAYDSYIDDLQPEWLGMSNLGDRDAIIYNNGEDVHTWSIFKAASATPEPAKAKPKEKEVNFWLGNYCIVDVQGEEGDFDLSESHPHTAIFVAASKKEAKRKFREFLEAAPEGKRYESDGKVKKTTCISLSHNI